MRRVVRVVDSNEKPFNSRGAAVLFVRTTSTSRSGPLGMMHAGLQASGCLVTVEREREVVDREGRTAARHRNGDHGITTGDLGKRQVLDQDIFERQRGCTSCGTGGCCVPNSRESQRCPGANVAMQTR